MSIQVYIVTGVEPPSTGKDIGAVSFRIFVVVDIWRTEWHSVVHLARVRRPQKTIVSISGKSTDVQSVFVCFSVDHKGAVLGRAPLLERQIVDFYSEFILTGGRQLVHLFQTHPIVEVVDAESVFVLGPVASEIC